MMLLMLPVAWPLAKLLDCLLGHDAGAFFRRAEFSAFVDLHKALQEQNEEPLDKFEVSVIQGVSSDSLSLSRIASRLASRPFCLYMRRNACVVFLVC